MNKQGSTLPMTTNIFRCNLTMSAAKTFRSRLKLGMFDLKFAHKHNNKKLGYPTRVRFRKLAVDEVIVDNIMVDMLRL